MTLPDGAVQVFSEITRFSALDVNGFVDAGAQVYTSNQMIEATATPNVETGVDLTQINANGDLVAANGTGGAFYKHGDMIKYYDISVKLSTEDPIIHQMLTGGVVYVDNTVALGLVTGTAAVAQITLGSLVAGTYGYRTTQYNAYGESAAATEVTAAVASGSAGTVVVSGMVMGAKALGVNIYGRSPGGEQFLGNLVNIGTQATSAVSGVGAVATLSVTALTSPIPTGYTFQITGDTNTVKIVFTTLVAAGVGATSLSVSPSQTVTTTIAAANIVPCFVDTGVIVPSGRPPSTDTTAGPGSDVGYQAPRLGIVGNPYGVGIEFFCPMTTRGTLTTNLPFNRWVFPGCRNMRDDTRNFGPTLMLPTYMGQAFENPNWGTGPTGDFQFDSSRVFQNVRCSAGVLPAAGLSPVSATY